MPKGVYPRPLRSVEHSQHLSESLKRFYQTHPNYYSPRFTDKHHTEEAKRQIAMQTSIAKRGKPNGRKGLHLSEETKTKISKALREIWKDKVTPHIPQSKEERLLHTKQRRSEAARKCWVNPSYREQQTQSHKNFFTNHPEVVKLIASKLKGQFSGANHPNWKGGKAHEPYPWKFNEILKEEIRIRDNYTCQICGVPQCECFRKLDIHHIDNNKDNLFPKNLISLCAKCHGRLHHQGDALNNNFENLGKEKDMVSSVDLVRLEHDRVFAKTPLTGRQLLSKRYSSKPMGVE